MRKSTTRLFLSLGLFVAVGAAFAAGVSPQDLGRLGKDLTPFGAEKAGNADGSIPAWDGGIVKPPAGYQPGQHYVDPFAADAVVATIDGKNMSTYAAKLSEGHKAMLAAYPSFRMKVYPTRRSASAPARIYEATAKTAASVALAPQIPALDHWTLLLTVLLVAAAGGLALRRPV